MLGVAWVVNGEIDVALGLRPSAEGEFGLPNMSLNSVPELPPAAYHLPSRISLPVSTVDLKNSSAVQAAALITRPSSQPFMRPRR